MKLWNTKEWIYTSVVLVRRKSRGLDHLKRLFFATDPKVGFTSQPIKVRPHKDSFPPIGNPTSSTSSSVNAAELALGEPSDSEDRKRNRVTASAITRHAPSVSSPKNLCPISVYWPAPTLFSPRFRSYLYSPKKPQLCKQKNFVNGVKLQWWLFFLLLLSYFPSSLHPSIFIHATDILSVIAAVTFIQQLGPDNLPWGESAYAINTSLARIC